eukprot:1161798-Pelagomonas_calceolata.AAC.4
MPSDFEDEEIDEELAFTEEDKKKYAGWFDDEEDEDDGLSEEEGGEEEEPGSAGDEGSSEADMDMLDSEQEVEGAPSEVGVCSSNAASLLRVAQGGLETQGACSMLAAKTADAALHACTCRKVRRNSLKSGRTSKGERRRMGFWTCWGVVAVGRRTVMKEKGKVQKKEKRMLMMSSTDVYLCIAGKLGAS